MPAARRPWIIAGAMLLAAAAPSDAPPNAPEAIGSWLLQCTEHGCILRNRDWILPPGAGGFAAALEVQRRGDSLVPVVTLRGLSAQQAVGGLLALQPRATLQFVPGPGVDLACDMDGAAVMCAPQGDAIATTSAALPSASQVEVGVRLGVPGLMPMPPRVRVLALQDTREALARLRSAGAAGESLPAEPGLDWIGFVHKIMQAAGINRLGEARRTETH
ncbi:MAG TPA: hypothetical protein VME47_07840 [Acetobacteraceae bacterium]|nr:hypothetical protein [Acetobacteraceae bacterium]